MRGRSSRSMVWSPLILSRREVHASLTPSFRASAAEEMPWRPISARTSAAIRVLSSDLTPRTGDVLMDRWLPAIRVTVNIWQKESCSCP